MEDTFKFLLVAAVIVIGLVKQFKKSAKESTDSKPAMTHPTAENPLPEYWGGDTYGGYIPEGPKPEAAAAPLGKEKTVAQHKATQAKKDRSIHTAISSYQNTTSSKSKDSPPPSGLQESEEPSEFSIRSAEEARRAIIWSEILQLKY